MITSRETELLAPRGILRAGINLANPLLVSATTGAEPDGLAPALAAAVADVCGTRLVLVPYPDAQSLVLAADADEWDIAFIAADPAREAVIDFTPPFAQIEARFMVHRDARYTDFASVDRPGVRIIAHAGSAYALWLAAHLASADLMPVTDDEEALRAFGADDESVVAGLSSTLAGLSREVPGSRVLDWWFMTVQQAVGVPRSRPGAVAVAAEALAGLTNSGLVAAAIDRFELGDRLTIVRS